MKLILGIYLSLSAVVSFALDAADVQLMDKFGIVGSKVRLHDDSDWSVDASKMDKDDYAYGHDEFKDLTDWKNINANDWFDLGEWKKNRKMKDKTPQWRTFLRDHRNAEIVGRVLKCIGVCRYYHGLRGIKSHYQTVLREGDEFMTESDSYAWLTLIDGSLIRISPKSSITLTEVNLSTKRTFFLIRLNYGQINTQARLNGKFDELNQPETDLGFYPLMIKEANREYYAMKEYRGFDESDKLIYSVVENSGHMLQYQTLNKKIKENFEATKPNDSHLFIYTPNVSLNIKNAQLNIFYAVNGETHFKVSKDIPHFKQQVPSTQIFDVGLRGYNNKEKKSAEFDTWYEVNSDGQEMEEKEELAEKYAVADAFISRIPTIHLARENFFKKYSSELYSKAITAKELITIHRYSLWEDPAPLDKRLAFLDEYVRRVETTNLKTITKVFKDIPVEKFDKTYFAKAMSKHYFSLRMQYTESQKSLRELDDNEYYLWLLKNGK